MTPNELSANYIVLKDRVRRLEQENNELKEEIVRLKAKILLDENKKSE
jgi:hypothetical protein